MPRLWVQGYHRGRAVDSDPGEITLDKISQVTMFNMVALEYVYAWIQRFLKAIGRRPGTFIKLPIIKTGPPP
jgi:hypothetical protein